MDGNPGPHDEQSFESGPEDGHFLELPGDLRRQVRVRIQAYVLMPNHALC